jgi:hypothetical protein
VTSAVAVLAGLGVVTGSALLVTRTERTGNTTSAPHRTASAGSGDPVQTSETGRSDTGKSTESGPTTPTTEVPRSTDPVVALVQALDGAYNGTWSNLTAQTTGQVALQLRIDPATSSLQVVTDLTGDLFGLKTAKRRHLESTISLLTPGQSSTLTTADFGILHGSIDAGFAVQLDAPDVPDPGVRSFSMRGVQKLDGSGFAATFTVGYDDGTTATGTMNVACSATGQRPSAVVTLCEA